MTDPLRQMSGYIEQFGTLKIRDRRGRSEIELMLQFDNPQEAVEVGVRYRRKVYSFNDVHVLYFSGAKMFLWLAACRGFVCPAHRDVFTLCIQIHELNKKRRVLGDLQIKGVRPRVFKQNCRAKSLRVAEVRARLFEELRAEQEGLIRSCPVWGALGVPHQRRLREWWASERPAENAEYWRRRA